MTSRLVLGGLYLLMLPIYIIMDIEQARWLPWWRRYAPSVCIALQALTHFVDQPRLNNLAFLAWLIAYIANRWTSSKNNRNRRDHKKLEAETRLTEVQQRSFRRQTAEAQA